MFLFFIFLSVVIFALSFKNFTYFIFGCTGLHCLHRFSLVAMSRGHSSLWCTSFSLWWLLVQWSTRLQGPQASVLGCTGLVATWHVGSPLIKDQTCVPSISRWILHHWTTREIPCSWFSWTGYRSTGGHCFAVCRNFMALLSHLRAIL